MSALLKLCLAVVVCAVLAPRAVSAQVDPMVTARSLIGAGQHVQAYELLMGLEPERSGEPNFDYLLGVAALESGEYSEALFALRRAVAGRPADLGARLDLGRAYYGIGDYASAREEFRALQGLNPPPSTGEVIAQYLRSIRRRLAHTEPRFSASMGVETGYDSNANSATDLQEYRGFRLRHASREIGSSYSGLVGQSVYSIPIRGRWNVSLAAEGLSRRYFDAGFLDRQQFGAGVGVAYRSPALTVKLGASGSRGYIDSQLNERIANLDLTLRRSMAQHWHLRADVRHSLLRYADLLDLRNVDSWLASFGSVWTEAGRWRFSFIAGEDEPTRAVSPFGRRLLGADTQVTVVGRRGWQWIAGTSLLASRYHGEFTNTSRRDQHLRAALAVNMVDNRLAGWLLRPEVVYERNRSGIDLYSYQRLRVGFQIRRVLE